MRQLGRSLGVSLLDRYWWLAQRGPRRKPLPVGPYWWKRQQKAEWTPDRLGSTMIEMWDAEDAAKFTLSGAEVTAWAGSKLGLSMAQADPTRRPTYGATSFNGRPGVSFEEAPGDCLEVLAPPFPIGSAPCELWVLMSQDLTPAEAGTRRLFSYGDATNTGRDITRTAGNRVEAQVGTGVARPNVTGTQYDFSGRHVARAVFGAAATSVYLDGLLDVTSPQVPATVATRARIGASSQAEVPFGFAKGVFNMAAITGPMTDGEAAEFTAYLKRRGGIA